MSKPLADPRAARAAALAAAEARLRGDPSSSSSSSSPPKPVMPAWQPSEKSDAEKRKEFTRLLYRGIVRDNGYKQASECLEVSRILASASRGLKELAWRKGIR